MAKKCSDCYLGGTVKVSRLDGKYGSAARVLALLLTLILVSCAGGSSSKVTSDDESDSASTSGWSSSDGTDWEVEELDLTDTDGDGVPDYIEEPYGTENDPFSYPDVYSQLEDDPAFENDGYPDASDILDLAGSAGTTLASYMLARGIAKNTPYCVTPAAGMGNIIPLDRKALVNAGVMIYTADSITQITFTMGGKYTRTVLSGTTTTGVDTGTYEILTGYIQINETGLTCQEMYSASVAEVTCRDCTSVETETGIDSSACTDDTVRTKKEATTWMGWADPINDGTDAEGSKTHTLKSASFKGIDVQTADVYYQNFSNQWAAADSTITCNATDKERIAF